MRSERKKSNLLAMAMKTHQALFVIILVAMLPIPVFSDMPMATSTEEPPLIQFTNAHLTNLLVSEFEYYGVFLVGAKIYLGFENMGGSGTVTILFNTFGPDRSETYEIENAGRYDLFIHVGLRYSMILNDELKVSSPNQIGNSKVYPFGEAQIISIKEILLIPILPPPEVYYVDHRANGSGNGLNWENALQHVQTALQLAKFYEGSVHEIRVAQGTYQPDTLWSFGLVRNATFQFIDDIEVKGGYAGVGSPDPNDRDVNLFETILSGDRAGNDVDVNDPCDLLNEPTRDENSYHVVTGSGTDASAVLDGFIITAGNANWSLYGNNYGGGMITLSNSSPTLIDCTFSGNSAEYGAGMFNYPSSPAVTNCTFSSNWADYGGGMYNSVNSSPTLTNCTFSGNSAERGGGMNNQSSNPTVTDCIFSGNSGATFGGGMRNYDSNPAVTNCTFSGNSAEYGGGMHNQSSNPTVTGCTFSGNLSEWGGGMRNHSASPALTDCTFSDNSADNYGGGMLNVGNSSPMVIGCLFSSNSADYGGGMLNFSSSPILTNCTFTANSADSYGGGIYEFDNSPNLISCAFSGNVAGIGGGGTNIDDSRATLVNCTFRGNAAANGNALACESEPKAPSNVELANCILWDGGSEIWNNDSSTITVTFSDVQGGWPGLGNIDADPSFLDPGHWDPNGTPNDPEDDFWVDGDYYLMPGSPCIDAGDNTAVPPDANDIDGDGNTTEPIPLDLDGKPRFSDDPDIDDTGSGTPPIVDIGAYEFQETSLITGDFCGPPGSVEPDGYVDYWDLLYFAQRWHSIPIDTNWDPRCDLDKEDNYVDYWDLLVFAQQWHKGQKPE